MKLQVVTLRYAVIGGLSCVALSTAPFAQTTGDVRVQRALDGLRAPIAIQGRPDGRWSVADRMATHRVPGASIAIVDGGRIIWTAGLGVAGADDSDRVTSSTLFQAQSISKMLTATAALMLIDDGKLSLDSPINSYLRSWQLPDNDFQSKEKVTLRRLLSHSAGVTVGGFAGYRMGEPLPTLLQILDGAPPAKNPPIRVNAVPGSSSQYSGGGMMVLQQALTDVTAESFPVLMRRLVLSRVGMSLSTYDQPLPESRRAEAATGHDGERRPVVGRWPVQPELAAGGLWSTATDLARWMLAIADAWNGRAGALLSQRSAREMLSVQQAPFGLGPEVEGSGADLSFSHSGSIWGFRARLVMYPALGKGAVIMTNSDGGDVLIPELLTAIASEFDWPRGRQVERDAVTLTRDQLEALVGRYSMPPGPSGTSVYLEVSRRDDQLFARIVGLGPRPAFDIHPASADDFFTTNGFSLSFVRDGSGRALAVKIGALQARREP